MTEPQQPAGLRYLTEADRLLERLAGDEWPALLEAARTVAAALADGHTLHAFGTGHSHMLAEELFYRAGGLVRVSPILFDGLMLHASASLSTSLERLPGLAAALLADHQMSAGDVLVVASNSGGNAVAAELAEAAQGLGVGVIAVTSRTHATSSAARGGRGSEGRALHQIADVVIDNGGCVGDAAVQVDGFERKVGPTSTVVGAAILNAIVVQAVELLVERGITPEVYSSSNVEGGDAVNAHYVRSAGAR